MSVGGVEVVPGESGGKENFIQMATGAAGEGHLSFLLVLQVPRLPWGHE